MSVDVLDAIQQRWSVRAFLDKAVSREQIETILSAAARAPSGVNTQPWQVVVVEGAIKKRISQAFLDAHRAGQPPNSDYDYYPNEWKEPYKSRRFACGMALYGALGIQREDHERRQEVWELNYHFFHAPVGLFFLIDANLEKGSWLDSGMFIQNVMLAAIGVGLGTCPQAALAQYPDIVRQELGLSESQHVICGMALGYPDESQPINQYRTERLAVNEFTQWRTADNR